MPETLSQSPSLPRVPQTRDVGVVSWARSLTAKLVNVLAPMARRLNGSIHQDGGIAMAAPLALGPYTTATLPDATEHEGAVIYVSDGASGEKFRGSDGTSWVNLG